MRGGLYRHLRFGCFALLLLFIILATVAVFTLTDIKKASANMSKYYAYFGYCVGDACGV